MSKSRNIARKLAAAPEPPKPIKLDLGCGKSKAGPEWTGVDSRKFDGVDLVADLRKPWPWKDGSVEEARASHFVEHLEPNERIHFVNELCRVLRKGGTCQIIVPHWASCRAYGDLTHKWPPVSEFWFYYLNAKWRTENAPHNDQYTCDFDFGAGYGMRQDLLVRPADYQQFALANYKEAASDIVAMLTKR
jgi:hypothetical protein